MSSETLKFRIGLSATAEHKGARFVISVNGKEFVKNQLCKQPNETEYFEFDAELQEGDNSLEICLLNKTNQDTVKDQNGRIVKDYLLNIDSIEIDDLDIGMLKWSLSSYYPDYPVKYRQELVAEGKELSAEVKNCVNLGWNGTWKLPFTSPFYIWLLENI